MMVDEFHLEGLGPPPDWATVVDDDGRRRCAACWSETHAGRCPRCDDIGAEAIELES